MIINIFFNISFNNFYIKNHLQNLIKMKIQQEEMKKIIINKNLKKYNNNGIMFFVLIFLHTLSFLVNK